MFKSGNNKAVRFLRLSVKKKYLCLEALFWLFLSRFIIVIFPLKYYNRLLLGKDITSLKDVFFKVQDPVVDDIARAVKVCNEHVPWENRCLAAAVSAKIMLALRGHNSVLYVGINKKNDTFLASHSWLRCGEKFVIGGKGKDYVLVSKFR